MSLQRYLYELTQFGLSLEEIIKNIVEKNEGKILFIVKNRLYNTGTDGSGKSITPSYTNYTIEKKSEKGQRRSFVTLRDTGLFYKGFFLELKKYVLLLSSTDEKTSSLINKYGEAILEFNDFEKEYIINTIIEPELIKIINNLDFNSSSAGTIELDAF